MNNKIYEKMYMMTIILFTFSAIAIVIYDIESPAIIAAKVVTALLKA